MEELTELAVVINKDLNAGDDRMLIPMSGIDYSELHARLTSVIGYMLEYQFEKLCNVMYRLDVPEKKFRKVMKENAPDDIAPGIAELVIEREIQKIRTRILYKNKQL